jgi:RNA polymerase sigma-70 factor, ECF subfamily
MFHREDLVGQLVKELDPSPSSTSLTLLERVKTNDPEGWRRLVRLYCPLVYRWCRRQQLHDDDAADISQEVFRTVAARIADFRRAHAGDSFRGWLWTITRHKIGDHFRQRDRQPRGLGGSAAQQRLLALPEQLPEDDDSAADSCSLVHRALQLIHPEFEERTWQAFWRVTVSGHAARDVAADLGVTPDAVRMAKSRVLRRLRQELPDWASGDPSR